MKHECSRGLECGDLSSLFRLWPLVAKAGLRAAARGASLGVLLAFDGDKSPAESADKSAHSKACGCGVSRVRFIRGYLCSCLHGLLFNASMRAW